VDGLEVTIDEPAIVLVEDTGKELTLDADKSTTDENGTRWTANSYQTTGGEGETFGPNHPNPPSVVLALRKDRDARKG
jgi:hypothetical protein